MLLQGWGLILVGGLMGAGIGLLASMQTPTTYESVATLVLSEPPDQTGVFTLPGIRSVFRSATLATEIIAEFGLDRPPHSLSSADFLNRVVTIEDVPNTYLVRLRVRLPDSALAQKVAARLADKSIERVTSLWQEGADAKRTRAEKQAELARAALSEAEQRLLRFRRESGLDLLLRDVERLFWTRLATGATRRRGPASLPSGQAGSPEQIQEKELELIRLETDVDVRRAVYGEMSRRHEEARVTLAAGSAPLRLVDPPAAAHALPGTRSRTVAVGALAGLILAACLVIAREWRATR